MKIKFRNDGMFYIFPKKGWKNTKWLCFSFEYPYIDRVGVEPLESIKTIYIKCDSDEDFEKCERYHKSISKRQYKYEKWSVEKEKLGDSLFIKLDPYIKE